MVARITSLPALLIRISALAAYETSDDFADAKKINRNTSKSLALVEVLVSPPIVYRFVPLLKVENANSDRII